MCINKVRCNGYPAGYWYCYSCGKHGEYDLKEVKMASKKARKCKRKKAVNWDKLVEEYESHRDILPKLEELKGEWKINVSALCDYYIGWDGEAYTVPMRDEETYIVGINRRFPDGSKCCVDGSRLGLFVPEFYYPQVVITEGFSDAAIAYYLGFHAIGKPSASFGELLVKKYLEKIGYKEEVVIVQDCDQAGVTSRFKLQAALRDWKIKVIVPPTDLKDYYLANGKSNTINLLGD
jgi:hypothetical protein